MRYSTVSGLPPQREETAREYCAGVAAGPATGRGDGFNLAKELAQRLPRIHGHEPLFVIHNDAVVQGLSEVPAMQAFQ